MLDRSVFGQRGAPQRSRREAYLEEYNEAKKRGESFYPFTIFKDSITSLVVFGVLLLLAYYLGAELEPIADPTDTTYNPRPEWYFLFLFELLKYFPGELEALGAIGLPGVLITVLLLLPFFDRSPERHPLKRPVAVGTCAVIVAGIAFLTYRGTQSEAVAPPPELSELALEGRRMYGELRCEYCHSIQGEGGIVGPDLAAGGSHAGDPEWIRRHFEDPQSVVPGSVMPHVDLTPEEADALTAYVLVVQGKQEMDAAAQLGQQLYKEKRCEYCHSINGSGGVVGPDLAVVGARHNDAGSLKQHLQDPRRDRPGSVMPQLNLMPDEVEALTAYILALRGAVEVTETVSFREDVLPIFKAACTSCHGTMGGLDLSSYDKLMAGGNSGPPVVPGDPKASLLVQRLLGKGNLMPPTGKLTSRRIATIEAWIEQGAEDN